MKGKTLWRLPFKSVKLHGLQFKTVLIGNVKQAKSHPAISLKTQKGTVKNSTRKHVYKRPES